MHETFLALAQEVIVTIGVCLSVCLSVCEELPGHNSTPIVTKVHQNVCLCHEKKPSNIWISKLEISWNAVQGLKSELFSAQTTLLHSRSVPIAS